MRLWRHTSVSYTIDQLYTFGDIGRSSSEVSAIIHNALFHNPQKHDISQIEKFAPQRLWMNLCLSEYYIIKNVRVMVMQDPCKNQQTAPKSFNCQFLVLKACAKHS